MIIGAINQRISRIRFLIQSHSTRATERICTRRRYDAREYFRRMIAESKKEKREKRRKKRNGRMNEIKCARRVRQKREQRGSVQSSYDACYRATECGKISMALI